METTLPRGDREPKKELANEVFSYNMLISDFFTLLEKHLEYARMPEAKREVMGVDALYQNFAYLKETLIYANEKLAEILTINSQPAIHSNLLAGKLSAIEPRLTQMTAYLFETSGMPQELTPQIVRELENYRAVLSLVFKK